jgi:hypothetical protein
VSPVVVGEFGVWSNLRRRRKLLVSKELLESLSWRVSELVSKERKKGNLEFAGYQGCSGYDGCGVVVIYSVVSWKTEGVRRDSVVLYLSVRL